jgi:chorismate synthase
MEKRRPGQSRFVTQRQEPDTVRILSGVLEGVTTGTPIALHIDNVDQRSRDYSEIKDKFRPSHADYTYFRKYGVRDYRGGGRQSARETAVRVAAGAIARKVLGDGVTVRGAVVQLGTQKIDRAKWDWAATADNPFWCPDRQAGQAWEGYLDDVRKRGSSCGAIIEVVASGVPIGLGDPVYDKLDADLAKGLMSINAVKGVEIGDGFAVAAMSGEQDADEMRMKDGQPVFLSNHAGGILGGISSGQESLPAGGQAHQLDPGPGTQRRPFRQRGRAAHRGRPRVGIRATPVAEAMVAVVLADHLLRHRALGSPRARLSRPAWQSPSPSWRAGTLHNISMAVVALGMVGAAAISPSIPRPRPPCRCKTRACVVRPAGDRHGSCLARRQPLINRKPQVIIDRDGIVLGFGRNHRFAWRDVEWVRLRRLGFRPQVQIGLVPAAFIAANLRLSMWNLDDSLRPVRGVPAAVLLRDNGLDTRSAALLDAVRSFRPNLVRP